jgi:hypothetical protein
LHKHCAGAVLAEFLNPRSTRVGANSTTAAEAMLAFIRQGFIEVALWEETGSGSTGGPSIIFNGRPTLTPNIAATLE